MSKKSEEDIEKDLSEIKKALFGEPSQDDIPEFIGGATQLKNAIYALAHDNCMPLRPESEWPKWIDYKYLESEAGRFESGYELNDFVTGEIDDIKNLTEKYKVHDLHKFMNLIFDGDLSDFFFFQ